MQSTAITSPEAFGTATALVLDFFTGKALNETPHDLSREQVEWFREHCDRRFRWYHANNPAWRKWLENRDPRIDPRDQCMVWIRHWLQSYLLDPQMYRQRHEIQPSKP